MAPLLCRIIIASLALAAGTAAAADLPHRRHIRAVVLPRPTVVPRPLGGTPVIVPSVPLAPVVIAPPSPGFAFMPVLPDPRLAPRRGGCRPGYMIDADDVCRRNGDLLVACDPYGGPCSPLPPTPIPYGIGPYLRLNY